MVGMVLHCAGPYDISSHIYEKAVGQSPMNSILFEFLLQFSAILARQGKFHSGDKDDDLRRNDCVNGQCDTFVNAPEPSVEISLPRASIVTLFRDIRMLNGPCAGEDGEQRAPQNL